jgi:hypothetical protein
MASTGEPQKRIPGNFWQVGQIAEWEAKDAERLIARGYAKRAKPPGEPDRR